MDIAPSPSEDWLREAPLVVDLKNNSILLTSSYHLVSISYGLCDWFFAVNSLNVWRYIGYYAGVSLSRCADRDYIRLLSYYHLHIVSVFLILSIFRIWYLGKVAVTQGYQFSIWAFQIRLHMAVRGVNSYETTANHPTLISHVSPLGMKLVFRP